MSLLPIVAGGPGSQHVTATVQSGHQLGNTMVLPDGRRFSYGRAGAVTLVAGNLCQQTLNDANFDELVVPTARAIGDKTVTVTTGATAVTLDQLKDGYAHVEDAAGEGFAYSIKSNEVAATTSTLTMVLHSGLVLAWTTVTTVGIFANPYSVIIRHPAPATAWLCGVAAAPIPITNFGWLQTNGPCSVLTEGTVIINEKVIDSATADGACAPTASTAAGEENYVGVVMEAAITTEHSLINLNMN